MGILSVKVDSLLQTVKVCHAIGTVIKVAADLPALRGVYSLAEIVADVSENFLALDGLFLHDVM
jgi:hypothetical protein